MKSSSKVRFFGHDVLEGCDGIGEVIHSNESQPNILHYFHPCLLLSCWDLIQCHSVEFDGLGSSFLEGSRFVPCSTSSGLSW